MKFNEMPELNLGDIFRFLSKCSEPDENGCINWLGTSCKYGQFYLDRKSYMSHRISYFLSIGQLPRNKLVRHLCHNKHCVNPLHLDLGDSFDNARDSVVGNISKSQKLTFADVQEIRKNKKENIHILAQQYNVTNSTIGNVLRNETFVDENYEPLYQTRRPGNGSIYQRKCNGKFSAKFGNKYLGDFLHKIDAENAIFEYKKLLPNKERIFLTLTNKDIEDFWNLVENTDGCWIWQGGTNNSGYGVFTRSKSYQAHRLSYMLSNNLIISSGEMLLHSCNQKLCVNPKHLRIGTYKDNALDIVKGNYKIGQKLSFQDAKVIRNMYISGSSRYKLSQDYEVSLQTISAIIRNEIYCDPNYNYIPQKRKRGTGSIWHNGYNRYCASYGKKHLDGSFASIEEAENAIKKYIGT